MNQLQGKLNYLTPSDQINKVTEEELIEALEKVNKKNLDIRRSFKTDMVSLSMQVSR